MQKRTSVNNFRSSRLYCTMNSSIIGIIITFGCLLLFSILMSKLDVPESIVAIMSSVSLCIGAYSGGYISSKKRRQKGLLTGIITGVVIYCIILCIGVFFAKNSISFTFVTKLILTLTCAAIGGVVGVNAKGKRY